LVYQGASDDFRGPMADIEFPDASLGIDMEGEFGVILSDVPIGTTADAAPAHVRLLVQINDWSLRALGPREMRAGFGFLQAKPSTSFAPVAITPDEIGSHWQDCRVKLPLRVEINGREVGRANGAEMHFSFAEIVAHCARTRKLTAGTIVGSGTVSNADRTAGSSCISEIRVIELLDLSAAETPFLTWGDRVRMEAQLPDGTAPFGVIDQTVVQA
jgi:fumarylacetoacetate (FAA) hydrolase